MRLAHLAVLVVVAWCSTTSLARAGACADARDGIVIEPLSGEARVGTSARFRVRAVHFGRGGWPDCVSPQTPFDTPIAVSARTPSGVLELAVSSAGEVTVPTEQVGY